MTDFGGKKAKDAGPLPLPELFKAYCKMDPTSYAMNVDLLPLSQSDDWLRKATILDSRNVTTTDTGLLFFKFRKRAINYEQFLQYIRELAETKDLDLDEVKEKLQSCPRPTNPHEAKKKVPQL